MQCTTTTASRCALQTAWTCTLHDSLHWSCVGPRSRAGCDRAFLAEWAAVILPFLQGHLNAAALDRAFLRPVVLITDADNALYNPPDNRLARDKELLNSAVSTLRKGGMFADPYNSRVP